MAGVGVRVDVRGAKKLRAISDSLNLRQIFKLLQLDALAWIDSNFKQGGREKRWRPLRPSTIYGRRRKSRLPLQDTGALRQSFITGQPVRQGQSFIEVGSNLDLAEWHHSGTRPYIIRPRRRKRLAFPHQDGNTTLRGTERAHHRGLRGFLAKEVRHPGLPARPLLPSERTASDRAERVVVQILRGAGGDGEA